MHGRDLLMSYSANIGDYKFPGGGVEPEESHAQALYREVQEECGMSVLNIGSEIGVVIEHNVRPKTGTGVFQMTSHYYFCDVEDGVGILTLDDYEQELGLQPAWIDIDRAIRLNKALLPSDHAPRWLQREIFVLEYIRHNILQTPDTEHLKPGAEP